MSAKAKRALVAPRRTAPKISPSYEVDSLPDIYCMKLEGNCLEPLVPNHASIVLKKSESVRAGDIVCIWFHPRLLRPGMPPAWLKRLQMNVPPWVKFPYTDHPESEVLAALIVEQINPERSYRMKCSDVVGLHKAIGHAPPCEIGGSIRSDTILPIGAGSSRLWRVLDPALTEALYSPTVAELVLRTATCIRAAAVSVSVSAAAFHSAPGRV